MKENLQTWRSFNTKSTRSCIPGTLIYYEFACNALSANENFYKVLIKILIGKLLKSQICLEWSNKWSEKIRNDESLWESAPLTSSWPGYWYLIISISPIRLIFNFDTFLFAFVYNFVVNIHHHFFFYKNLSFFFFRGKLALINLLRMHFLLQGWIDLVSNRVIIEFLNRYTTRALPYFLCTCYCLQKSNQTLAANFPIV